MSDLASPSTLPLPTRVQDWSQTVAATWPRRLILWLSNNGGSRVLEWSDIIYPPPAPRPVPGRRRRSNQWPPGLESSAHLWSPGLLLVKELFLLETLGGVRARACMCVCACTRASFCTCQWKTQAQSFYCAHKVVPCHVAWILSRSASV